MNNIEELIEQLYDMFIGIDNREDCANLLSDLCTYKEVENMAQRLKAAELLLEGYTYNQVLAELNISSATLSRVSKCVQHGKGYSKLIKKCQDL